MVLTPSRDAERELLRQYLAEHGIGANSPESRQVYLAGVDEVGRGSLAGPVSVGIALISPATTDAFPARLRDSKQISATVRESLVEPCRAWLEGSAVGHAQASEIDEHGIIGGLRIAAARAVAQLVAQRLRPAVVLLDGSHDWWTQTGLFALGAELPVLPVQTLVKGDAQAAVVAAASVIAKVERDALMREFAADFPHYDFASNKGYSSPKHIAALHEYGPSAIHRVSWNLP